MLRKLLKQRNVLLKVYVDNVSDFEYISNCQQDVDGTEQELKMSDYKTQAEERFLRSYPRSQMITEDVIYFLESAISSVRGNYHYSAGSNIKRAGEALAELQTELRDHPVEEVTSD